MLTYVSLRTVFDGQNMLNSEKSDKDAKLSQQVEVLSSVLWNFVKTSYLAYF